MNQEKINRINELYKKQKAGTITPEEKDEQSLIQEPDGTIHKLRKKETH